MYARQRLDHGRMRLMLAALAATAIAAVAAVPAGAAPGDYSQAQINQAIENGVGWVDSQQNPDGSFGSSYPEAETALAIISYGVLDGGDSSKLTATQRSHLQAAVNWLLGKQTSDGSWGGFLASYSTGLALLAFSYTGDLSPDIPAAVAKGRSYLLLTQNAPPSVTGNTGAQGPPGPTPDCSSDKGSSTANYCGGWNYNASYQRSDESNTGFALTGLAASGGVPAGAAAVNAGWQRNVQQLTSTGLASRNDGGGSYEPGINSGSFSSNANDTGSLIFGFAYDGVPAADTAVVAALSFGMDVLDEYELMKPTLRTMLYHTGQERDGTCVVGASGCDWQSGQGEGGYHYSLFALSKGFGQYGPADPADPANFYAKVVDLLLSQQAGDGSWPNDPRDDGSQLGATAFALMSLGRVGQPPTVSGTVYNDHDGNGARATGDEGLAGWRVYVDTNGNDAFDTGEPTATTAANGTYTIQQVPEGTFAVREVLQSGFDCTAPTGCAYPATKFALGGTLTGFDFGDRQPPAAAAVAPSSAVKHSCSSVRGFTIHIQGVKKYRIASVTVVVNNKRVKVRHAGGRFSAKVDLRSLPLGRFSVKITAKTRSGKTIHYTRRYRTCTRKLVSNHHPRL